MSDRRDAEHAQTHPPSLSNSPYTYLTNAIYITLPNFLIHVYILTGYCTVDDFHLPYLYPTPSPRA